MAYGQSKLANVLHANELARRLKVSKSFSGSTLEVCSLVPLFFLISEALFWVRGTAYWQTGAGQSRWVSKVYEMVI